MTGNRSAVVAIVALFLLACGHSFSSSAPDSSLLDPNIPRTPPFVTISAAGVSPVVVHVDSPATITFTNDDQVAHHLVSAPDLGWDDCPEFHTFAAIGPGKSSMLAFSEKDAVCTYRDAADPANKAFEGYIAIH